MQEESLALRRRLGDQAGIALVLFQLGDVAAQEGDDATARAFYSESLALRQALGDQPGIAECLEGFATLVAARGAVDRAVRLAGAAAACAPIWRCPCRAWIARATSGCWPPPGSGWARHM